MKSVDKQVMIIILRSLPGLLSKLKLTRGSYVFPLSSVWPELPGTGSPNDHCQFPLAVE